MDGQLNLYLKMGFDGEPKLRRYTRENIQQLDIRNEGSMVIIIFEPPQHYTKIKLSMELQWNSIHL